LFNLPTGLRLVELSQPNQLLLQRLLREAPGTYQHSLQVANLCEQAASAVGANAELVRVAALYHDIGKMLNPHFFVENQADGVNPHDELNDPYRSTDIILSHITEGDKLARQNRLPGRIRDFILEHHGTTRVEYFYRRALAEAAESEEVDPTDFTYPGPIPQSRETAIMMLADSCEGTVRARRPANRQEIQDIVQGIIDTRTRDGQLDESGLTANDLKTVRGVFVDMLQAVFHPRINYPSSMVAPKPKPTPTPESMAETMTMRAVAKPLMPETRKASGEVPSGLGDEDDASPMPEVPSLPRRTGILNATIFPDDDDEKDAP
jgi:putative nucleotidyltransferase with HDIG domain